MPKGNPAYQALIAYTDGLERELQRQILNAFKTADLGSLRTLVTLIESGNVDAAVDFLASRLPLVDMADAAQAMVANAARAAGLGELSIKDLGAVKLRFDVFDPNVALFLSRYRMDLITNITTQVREGIRHVISEGLREGRHPLHVARDVRQIIGLTPQQAQAVLNYRKQLLEGDLTDALRRKLRDRRFDPTLLRLTAGEAVETLPAAKIERMVSRYAERYLAHRAETIARTEAMRALAQGRRLAQTEARRQGVFPEHTIRRWYVAPDERVCPICRPIPRMNPEGRGLDEPFETPDGPVMDPPVHGRCRCTTFPEVASV